MKTTRKEITDTVIATLNTLKITKCTCALKRIPASISLPLADRTSADDEFNSQVKIANILRFVLKTGLVSIPNDIFTEFSDDCKYLYDQVDEFCDSFRPLKSKADCTCGHNKRKRDDCLSFNPPTKVLAVDIPSTSQSLCSTSPVSPEPFEMSECEMINKKREVLKEVTFDRDVEKIVDMTRSHIANSDIGRAVKCKQFIDNKLANLMSDEVLCSSKTELLRSDPDLYQKINSYLYQGIPAQFHKEINEMLGDNDLLQFFPDIDVLLDLFFYRNIPASLVFMLIDLGKAIAKPIREERSDDDTISVNADTVRELVSGLKDVKKSVNKMNVTMNQATSKNSLIELSSMKASMDCMSATLANLTRTTLVNKFAGENESIKAAQSTSAAKSIVGVSFPRNTQSTNAPSTSSTRTQPQSMSSLSLSDKTVSVNKILVLE